MIIEILILGIIGAVFGTAILMFGIEEESAGGTVFGFVAIVASIIVIALSIQSNCECTCNHNCEHKTTYTYQCKLCDETVKQTEEPKIKLCDECIATIKEIESEEIKNGK